MYERLKLSASSFPILMNLAAACIVIMMDFIVVPKTILKQLQVIHSQQDSLFYFHFLQVAPASARFCAQMEQLNTTKTLCSQKSAATSSQPLSTLSQFFSPMSRS